MQGYILNIVFVVDRLCDTIVLEPTLVTRKSKGLQPEAVLTMIHIVGLICNQRTSRPLAGFRETWLSDTPWRSHLSMQVRA